MKSSSKKNGLRWWTIFLIPLVVFVTLGGGYWLYRQSISRAVYDTTVSFMEQIADHDHLNLISQMDSKWEYLNSLLNQIEVARESSIESVVYDLGVTARSTSFEKLYLITADGLTYSSSYLETPLQEMPWGGVFRQSQGNFVARYDQDNREQWGEYLIYGIHLAKPAACGDKEVLGAVGLVPISEIASQMRLESFDGRGVALLMQPSGEIVTASQQYSSSAVTQNFLTSLTDADFKGGGSLEACRQAIARGESLFTEYSLEGERFYALFQPMEHHDGTNWYLVLRVSAQVTAEQAQALVYRSLPFFFVLGVLILGISYFVYHSLNAAQVARASEQAKSAFLANMSHEIRTPLNGIMGLQYLMRQNLDRPEKLEEYLQKAEVSADFLKSVITDVLDMSKIESGQLEIYSAEMDLSALVREIEVILGIQAEEKGLTFRLDCEGLCQPYVTGDALRIKQVLTNLLGNALKFTPKGGEISLAVRQRVEHGVAATTFMIRDNGCGMSPEFLARIWEPFEQEQRLASQNGTGLGTTLSKVLVEKMQGSITVESQRDKGTLFTVTLPLPMASPPAQSAARQAVCAPKGACQGKRILAVEDNEINRMIVASILEEQDCEVTEAADGLQAVEAFESRPAFYFDLILMDIQMPLLNGYEATRRIRALPRPDAGAVPIIAMTANAFREDVDAALASGMSDVLTKPLDVALLLEKIKKSGTREERV